MKTARIWVEKADIMRIQGHIAGGILAAGASLAVIHPSHEIADGLLVLGAIGGSLPDWDILYYFAKKRSFTYDTDFRHHQWITHTFPFYLIPALLVYLTALSWNNVHLQWIALIFALSTSVHLIQDMYGSGDGIKIFYPFSQRMFGFELTGNHGPEWLEQYLKSKSYKVELATNALALIFVAAYLIIRLQLFNQTNIAALMGWVQMANTPTELMHIAQICLGILYVGLTIFHGGTILILLSNVILQGIVRFTQKDQSSFSKSPSIRDLFQSSLAFNATLALISTCALVVIVYLLPITLPRKLTILPLVISAVSYLWGWRTTTIGVINGSAWTVVGLALFAFLEPQVSWWVYTPYFLFVNLLSNMSGWLGGIVNCGQVRESACITNIEIDIQRRGSVITKLFDETNNVLTKSFDKKWQKHKQIVIDHDRFTIAYNGEAKSPSGIIINGRQEMEWVYSYRPWLDAFHWIFQRPIRRRRLSEIISCVFNLHRRVVTHIVVKITPGKKTDSSSMQLVIMTFRETPSIVWVDNEVIVFARQLHTQLLKALDQHLQSVATISHKQFTVIRSWKGNITFEQFAKDTWMAQAANRSELIDIEFDSSINLPDTALMEFKSAHTVFDKWRGQATTAVVFIGSQILLGIFVSILASMMGQIP